MFPLPKFRICSSIIIVAFAALLVGLLDRPAAHAQQEDDRDFVDVGLTLEVPDDNATLLHFIEVILVNNGTRTAYDVEVTVDVVSPENSRFVITELRGEVQVPVGQMSVDGRSLVWTIPELGPLQREVLTPLVEHERTFGAGIFDNSSHPHEIFGTVTTASFESDRHKGNNTDRVWSYQYSTRHNYWIQAAVDYSVDVSVDNPQPSPGETVNFTITAGRETRHAAARLPPPIDLKVDIELTGGLSHTGMPSFYSSNPDGDPVATTYSAMFQNDEFTIGTGEATDNSSSDSVTLPVAVASDAVVNEQCLTATLTSNPPPGNGPLDDAIANNVAKLCLGGAEPFASGQVDAFTVYPCVGITDAPCDSSDDIRVRAVHTAYSDAPLPSGTTVFWLDPKEARIYDGHTNSSSVLQSVNNGNTVSWQTAVNADSRYEDGLASGVELYYSKTPWVNKTSGWAFLTFGISARDVNGNTPPPGKVFLRSTSSGNEIRMAVSPNYQELRTTASSITTARTNYFLEFEKLGTYKFTLHAVAGRSTLHGSENCNPTNGVNQGFCGDETYIFHLGPMADLAVEDGGASPHVADDQHALTMVAVNNGPDNVGAAKVTGLPTGADVLHVTQGAYNSTTGVWDIVELRPKGYYSSRGEPEPTLVLSAANGAAANVSIAAEDYEVCIGPKSNPVDLAHTAQAACEAVTNASWNSTPVYDHNAGNNTATITARAGTGGGEHAPASLVATETSLMNILMWELVAELHDLEVTHYQVERWANLWTPLANLVTGTVYLDMGQHSNADYRVRALNAAGVPGPWSITGRPPDAPGDFAVALSDSGNGAVLSWTEPASPTPITGYVIDISDSAEGDSRTNDVTLGGNVTTWTHTGLSGGDVKFYRVQARNRDGVGPWTDWQSVSTGPGAPGSLRARANGPSEIVLTWNEASSRDVTIYEYDLEYSDTSASEGYEWNFLQTVLHDEGLRYVDNTVSHGTTRYYRVRARTLQGNVGGAWSNVASATTSAAGPSAPGNLIAQADGESRIRLTWDAPASGDAVRYNINHSTDGSAWETERTGHTGTCSVGGQTKFCYTDSGLLSGTTHHYRVASVNRSGAAGEWSGAVFATTTGEPTEAPGEPQNLRITSVSGRQVSLAWDAPADDGGTRVTGYEYMVEGPCVHAPEEICQVVKPTRVGGTSRTVTVPNFRGHYGFYVRALNAVGAGWWSQPVGQYINPQRNWRVELLPSRLAVKEDSEATYRVKLTSDPGQPVWVALDWYGDDDLGEGHPDRGIPSLSEQQFKWLLPTNYANRNPDIYLDPDYTAPWNTGVTITVTALEDGDSENGTAEIRHDVFYIPCAELGNPAGCVDDPDDTGVTAYLTVTEEDND